MCPGPKRQLTATEGTMRARNTLLRAPLRPDPIHEIGAELLAPERTSSRRFQAHTHDRPDGGLALAEVVKLGLRHPQPLAEIATLTPVQTPEVLI